jgi:molybdopterin adenylyltransferase
MTSNSEEHRLAAPEQLRFAAVTVSDTRTIENDHSGQLLIDEMCSSGHLLLERSIVPDMPEKIAAKLEELLKISGLDVILMTGGTGISPRDRTPETVEPMLEVLLPGFGELFRMLSFAEIGPAAMLSRATAGRIGSVLIFCLPGSTAAVRLGMHKLLLPELPHIVHHARS